MSLSKTESITPKAPKSDALKLITAPKPAAKHFNARIVTAILVLICLFIAAWTIPLSPSTIRTTRIILGITGTLLMLGTEFIYSYRKEGLFKKGSIKTWLRIHIATGLIGPAMVLWHADFRFPGLAGALTYLTIIVVISGFIGRYIYRRLPRTIKGHSKSVADLKNEEERIEQELHRLLSGKPQKFQVLNEVRELTNNRRSAVATLWSATANYYIDRRRIHHRLAGLGNDEKAAVIELRDLIDRRLMLERSLKQLNASKKLLAKWNIFHKPLTLTMFAVIGIHVLSIFYYGKVL